MTQQMPRPHPDYQPKSPTNQPHSSRRRSNTFSAGTPRLFSLAPEIPYSHSYTMNIEAIRNYCLSKEDVTEGFPFGPSALVFKTSGKMFLLMMIDATPLSINLKCDPERAVELREAHTCVRPGYHMNKKHWNTVMLEPTLPPELLQNWIDHSYDLVRPRRNKATV